MDTQEYLGFVAILEHARGSIDAINRTHFVDISDSSSRLRQVMAELDKAIAAYREKANAQRS